jgi:hypothetical protein
MNNIATRRAVTNVKPQTLSRYARTLLAALFVFALAAAPAAAQHAEGARPLSFAEQRAVAALEQLATDVRGVEDEALKAHAQAQIADALWPHNEPLARRLFEEAFKVLAESNARRPRGASGNARYFLVSLLAGEMAARRDSDFARQLLGSLRPADGALRSGERRDGRAPNGSEQGDADPLAAAADFRPQSLSAAREEERDDYPEISQALNDEDFDRALSLIERISDPAVRAALAPVARQHAASAALSRHDYHAALTHARALPSLTQRAFLFVQLAQALGGEKLAGQAVEVLLEAERSLKESPPGAEQAQALMTVAGALARLDAMRGFELMPAVIEAVNRTDEAAKAGAGPELDAAAVAEAFSSLARVDFSRAWELAAGINRRETSLSARIALCVGLLSRAGGEAK